MQAFSARLEKRPGLFTNQQITLPEGITLMPRRWSVADVGGPKAATIEVMGTPENLAYLLTWLGDRAIIENEMSSQVWWGVVYEIEANLGGITVSLSLESVYNRVAVLYPFTLPDGSTESRRTFWAEDTTSINRYGKRELLYSLPDGVDDTATSVRDRLLRQFADPSPVISTRGQSKTGATLFCRGQWSLLDFVYWTNDEGLVSHEDSGGGVQAVGGSYTSNTISFGNPAGNDDYIKDTANNFGSLVEGTVIKISGAAQAGNNTVMTVRHQHGTNIIETAGNNLVDEAAGATVTIALGEFGVVNNIGQSFSVATGWTATRAALRVRRLGNPGDNLQFKIRSDSAGVPNTILASGELAGSSVPTSMNWVEIVFTTPLVLNAGTTYWVTANRSGAPSLADSFEVGLDEGLGHSGAMRVYNGSSWVTRDPDADLNFRIIGEVDSITQMQTALAVSPEFLSIFPKLSSGVKVDTYREDYRNVMDEVREMLDLGTSTGARLVARVDSGRNVIIDVVPESDTTNPMLGMDGRLYHASGALWEPGVLVAGRWIDIEAMPVLDGLTKVKGGRAIYVQDCEYDPATDRLLIQSEGALDPYQAIRMEKR